jgi:hypothetical protein
MFEHPEWIQLIPTPSIDLDVCRQTERLSKYKFKIPPCVVRSKQFQKRCSVNEIHSIATPQEMNDICRQIGYQHQSIDELERLFSSDSNNNICYILVPPRSLIECLEKTKNSTSKKVVAIRLVQVYEDLCIFAVFISAH